MEPTIHPELDLGPDHHFAKLLLAAVVGASLLAFVVLGVLAAAQPASASTDAPSTSSSTAAAAHGTGAWRTGIDGLDLALIALTLVGVAILVRRHAGARRTWSQG